MLRIPKSPERSQLYGIAVHSALKDFFDRRDVEGNADKKYLLERFEFHADHQPLKENDRNELKQKGQRALSGYYDTYSGSWPA